MLAFAFVFIACGDDDDDENGGDPTNTPAAGETPTEASNGDDDDDDNGSSGGGSEEDYVAGLCGALSGFETEMNESLASLFTMDPDATEEEAEEAINEVLAAFAGVVGDFADEVDDLNPPSDISDYHNQMVSTFREMRERLEDPNIDLMGGDDPFADLEDIETPSADVSAKYEAIALDTPECAGLDIFDPAVE